MSILKQISEGTALLEVSKDLVGRYLSKASDKIVDHAYDMGVASKDPGGYEDFKKARKKTSKRLRGVNLAKNKLTKEETELVTESNVNQAADKLSIHGYKKFGDSDKVDHKSVLTHFHNEKTGHLICVDHHPHGRINSVSTLKCTNPRTGEMQKEWGTEHSHVEHALRELGHNSHIGFKEEVELAESNDENKLKKNIYVTKLGMKSHPAIKDKEGAELHVALTRDNRGTSQKHAMKTTINTMKREGRRELKNPTKHEGAYHADYDRKSGTYNIKHRETGKIVAHNVANSGGLALQHADNWNKKTVKEEAIEEARKRGRPKKVRHEDGEIVNDPNANDTRPAV
jgi:hypothetical protein